MEMKRTFLIVWLTCIFVFYFTTRSAFTAADSGENNLFLLSALQSDLPSASGDYLNVLNRLSGLDVTALNAAAEQLSPLPHASLGTFKATLLRDMGSDMGGYLLARRNNTEHNIQFASLRNSDLLLADASENPDTLAYVITEAERREQMSEGTKQTNTFFRPFGVFFSQDSTDKFTGFHAKAVGAQFGADQVFWTNWIIGIGGAYSHSCLDFDEGFGSADIDSFRLGPYATYYLDKFYLDSSVSVGYHLNKTRREIGAGISRTAEGHYDAYDLAAYVGGGYEFNVRQWILSPTISTQYICYRNESFKESGAGGVGLNVDARTQESLLSRFGIRLYTMAIVETLKLAPEFFVGYAHEFMDEEDLQARFLGGVTKFSADVDSNRDDSVYFGAGLSGLINESTSAFVRYESECYRDSRSSALKLGLTLRF
jgi:outer membrane autotransporter protein